MRICLYTHTALPLVGGQELAVDRLAREFLAAGKDVVVVAPGWRRAFYRADRGLPYPVVRHPRFISMRQLVGWYAYWLVREHFRLPLDVIHSHGVYPTGFVVERARRWISCAHVVTAHGGEVQPDNPHFASRKIRSRYSEAVKSADALVAISRFTEEGYVRLLAGHDATICAIPNGVDCEALARRIEPPPDWASVAPPRKYFLYLGRLHRQKGVDVLLRAWAAASPYLDCQLVIAGDGPDRAALEQLAHQEGMMHRVSFVGCVQGNAKAYLLQNALGLVVPSRGWEGNSLVVLEGSAAGLPIVATRIPGLSEQVVHGETGLLCEPESAEALARSLRRVWSQPAEAQAMGERARRSVQSKSWREIAQRHLALYARVIARRPPAATA